MDDRADGDDHDDEGNQRLDMLFGPQRMKTPKRKTKKATAQFEEAKQEDKRGKRRRKKDKAEDGEDGPSRQERKSVKPMIANDKWSDESDPESDGDFKNCKKEKSRAGDSGLLPDEREAGVAVDATDASFPRRPGRTGQTRRSHDTFEAPGPGGLARTKTHLPSPDGALGGAFGALDARTRQELDASQDLAKKRSTDLLGLSDRPGMALALPGLVSATNAKRPTDIAIPDSAGGGPMRALQQQLQSVKNVQGARQNESARPGDKSIGEASERDASSAGGKSGSQMLQSMAKGMQSQVGAQKRGKNDLKAAQAKYNNFINDSLKDVSDKVKEVISTLNQIKDELAIDYERNDERARQQKEEEHKNRQVMKHLMNPVRVR